MDTRQIGRGGDQAGGGLGKGGSLAKCLRHTWQRIIFVPFFFSFFFSWGHK